MLAKANVFSREALPIGANIDGPALIIEPHQTIVVEQGWRAAITAKNHVLMTRVEPMPRREAIGAKADPVMLEIFNHLFMSIAEQMGVTLQNTAYSVNIKERLDFSCALFDREGRLIANAPHTPVRLGSMDRSVKSIIRDRERGAHPPGRCVCAQCALQRREDAKQAVTAMGILRLGQIFQDPEVVAGLREVFERKFNTVQLKRLKSLLDTVVS